MKYLIPKSYRIKHKILKFLSKERMKNGGTNPTKDFTFSLREISEKIGEKYEKSVAQIVLRWDLQKGVASIPKSVHKKRIIENSQIFDFELNEEEVAEIDALENNTRTGAHPDHFMQHFQNN